MLKGFGHVKWESTHAILGLPLRWKKMPNLGETTHGDVSNMAAEE